MAVEQRAGFSKQDEEVFAQDSLGSARDFACSFRRRRRNVWMKFAKARAPSPAREARALPRTSARKSSIINMSTYPEVSAATSPDEPLESATAIASISMR